MPNSRNYLHSLDALRGIGALSVCLYHSGAAFGSFGAFPHGYLAVDLFFMLSGFVAFYRLEDFETVKIGQGFQKRLARIYPTYLLALFWGAALFLWQITSSDLDLAKSGLWSEFLQTFALNFFMLPDFDTKRLIEQNPTYPFSIQNWTLFWELMASFAFLIWARFGCKFKELIAIVFAFTLLIATSKLQDLNQGYDAKGFITGGMRAFCGFAIGVVCAQFLKNDMHWSRFLAKIAWFLILISITYFAWHGATSIKMEYALVFVIFPILIIAIAQSQSVLFINPLMRFLGRISFSLFALHIPLLTFMFILYTNFGLFELNLISGTAYLLVLIIISAILERYFERKFRKAPKYET